MEFMVEKLGGEPMSVQTSLELLGKIGNVSPSSFSGAETSTFAAPYRPVCISSLLVVTRKFDSKMLPQKSRLADSIEIGLVKLVHNTAQIEGNECVRRMTSKLIVLLQLVGMNAVELRICRTLVRSTHPDLARLVRNFSEISVEGIMLAPCRLRYLSLVRIPTGLLEKVFGVFHFPELDRISLDVCTVYGLRALKYLKAGIIDRIYINSVWVHTSCFCEETLNAQIFPLPPFEMSVESISELEISGGIRSLNVPHWLLCKVRKLLRIPVLLYMQQNEADIRRLAASSIILQSMDGLSRRSLENFLGMQPPAGAGSSAPRIAAFYWGTRRKGRSGTEEAADMGFLAMLVRLMARNHVALLYIRLINVPNLSRDVGNGLFETVPLDSRLVFINVTGQDITGRRRTCELRSLQLEKQAYGMVSAVFEGSLLEEWISGHMVGASTEEPMEPNTEIVSLRIPEEMRSNRERYARCSICKEKIEQKRKICVTWCHHLFCWCCISKWYSSPIAASIEQDSGLRKYFILENCRTCPECRQNIPQAVLHFRIEKNPKGYSAVLNTRSFKQYNPKQWKIYLQPPTSPQK